MLRGVVGGWWLCSCNDIPVRPRQDPRRDLNLFELRTRSPAPREPGESRGRCAGYSREEHCVCRPAPHSSRHLHLSRSFLILVMSQWMWPHRGILSYREWFVTEMPRLTSYLLRSPSSAGACFPPVYIVHVAPRPRPPRAAAPRRAPPRAPHQNTIPRRTFIPTDISTQSTRIPTPIYLHMIYCTNWLLWQNI